MIERCNPNKIFEGKTYIVIGLIGKEENIPREVVLPTEDLRFFKQIQKASNELRGFYRRVLSLKRVVGFGIYECYVGEQEHKVIEMDSPTKRTLDELYRDYQSGLRDREDAWANWIHENFNQNETDPMSGKYALQPILGWSIPKLAFWGTAPILLSLAIGFWYMFALQPGEDKVAVVQTAWTISSYIVTSAAREYRHSLP